MYTFTVEQKRKALVWLSFWHIVVIAASNYLVQFPFNLGNIHSTWGSFSFPFIFLTTDLTVRIFGASLARRIIFCVMIPALIISYIVSVIFQNGSWAGLGALTHLDTFVARIALASFCAYIFGQLMDVLVFNKLRQTSKWWLAPTASTIFGCALDTLIFFSVAFYNSPDSFMAANWPELAIVDYATKLSICALFFLPMYGVLLNYLLRKLTTLENQNQSMTLHLSKSS